MPRRSSLPLWLACLALLLHLLGMPHGSARPAPGQPQVLWSSFCTAHGVRLVPVALAPTDAASQPADQQHDSGLQGACCCGQAGGPALPAESYRTPTPALARSEAPTAPLLPHQPLHRRWPRLNPRASPAA